MISSDRPSISSPLFNQRGSSSSKRSAGASSVRSESRALHINHVDGCRSTEEGEEEGAGGRGGDDRCSCAQRKRLRSGKGREKNSAQRSCRSVSSERSTKTRAQKCIYTRAGDDVQQQQQQQPDRQSDSCTLLVARTSSLDLILESVCSLSPVCAAPRNRVPVIHKFMTEGRGGELGGAERR